MRPSFLLVLCVSAAFASDPIQLPNGFSVTPLAAPHAVELPLNPGLKGKANLLLSQPVTTAVSPDGKLLLTLTSGYNKERGVRNGENNEYVFIYDATVFPPKQMQALPIPNTFCGLAWNPGGNEFYVSGGVDDSVYVFTRAGVGSFVRIASIPLGHKAGLGLISDQAVKPMVAGIGVNQSGTAAVVANFYNDSVSLIDLRARKVAKELDLRPGGGQPGGEYPYWIAIRGDRTAYVSSPRDREIVAIDLGSTPKVSGRIPVKGQPNRLILNKAQNRLYMAVDNADTVDVVDLDSNAVISTIGITAPEAILPKGANPNSLALSPDERTLYVSDGGTNAIAVVDLTMSKVTGLIPTGWYPGSVSVSADGKYMYVANGKSMPQGNAGNCRGDVKAPGIADCSRKPDSYVYQLEKGSLLTFPVPPAVELAALTRRVAENNHFAAVRARTENPVMSQLRQRIQHVIYIVKENRTYDQVLGDLEVGNGDPALAEFPEPVSPNHHALARNFVTLDNFFDSGEVSGVGWNWSVAARTTDYTEKTVPVNYAGRGFIYDWEGTNRNVNVGVASMPERLKAQPGLMVNGKADPDLLPGGGDVAAPDSDTGEAGSGYLWDEVLRAGMTVRNYGFFCDLIRYNDPKDTRSYLPFSKTPFADKAPQAVPTNKSLLALTDIYFRSFDQNFSDLYRFNEWEREFNEQVANNSMPNLTLLRLAHDHFGSFKTAADGINTPALEFADNDYAIAKVVEKVSKSSFAASTLIFIVEDDAQDGPDHVDAHRSIAYVVGPYVKQHAVISEPYNTVSMVGTMEAVLGLKPSSLYAAAAAPMTDVFDLNQSAAWSYTAKVPELLRTSQLPLPAATAENSLPRTPDVLAWTHDRHDAKYWNKKIGDMDYDVEDRLDTARFNRELWKGMMGNKPYPKERSGKNLREGRDGLLKPGTDPT